MSAPLSFMRLVPFCFEGLYILGELVEVLMTRCRAAVSHFIGRLFVSVKTPTLRINFVDGRKIGLPAAVMLS